MRRKADTVDAAKRVWRMETLPAFARFPGFVSPSALRNGSEGGSSHFHIVCRIWHPAEKPRGGGGWRVGGGLGVSTQATWSLRAAACAWLNSLKPRHPTRWPQYQWWALAYLPPVPAGWSCWCGSDWLGLGYKATTGESPAGGDTGGASVRRSSQSHLWGKYGEETGVFYSFLCWANVIRWL